MLSHTIIAIIKSLDIIQQLDLQGVPENEHLIFGLISQILNTEIFIGNFRKLGNKMGFLENVIVINYNISFLNLEGYLMK